MKRIPKLGVALVVGTLYLSAAWATPTPVRAESSSDSSVVAPVPAADAAMTVSFRSDACRVPQQAAGELAELGAFETWQGAATTPVGHRESLVYGALLQDSAINPVTDAVTPVAADETDSEDSQVIQRRRMFLLGLAILLNLNTKQ